MSKTHHHKHANTVMFDIQYCASEWCINNIQGVTGETDQTSGECSLGQTIPI